jgi:hypothetical protein
MKSFQIKDLTVILGQAAYPALCPIYTHIPPPCHIGGCTLPHHPSFCIQFCSFLPTTQFCHWGCTWHLPSYIPTPTIRDWTIQVEVELPNFKKSELEELRAGIAELQIKIEAQIKNSPDDLDLLESKMKEALEEIQRQKGNPKG